MQFIPSLVGALAISWALASSADSASAACAIYPVGEDHTDVLIPCRFSQRQGAVTISRSDGSNHDLIPAGDVPGKFRDQEGRDVYRQSGLGDRGLIFRFPQESVYVYWDTNILQEPEEDNPTAPFSTNEYDATALFRCRKAGDTEFGLCPGGILRMEDSQASIVVRGPSGEQFTINFMHDGVNATNRAVEAYREDDTWTLEFADGDVWEVPLAAIEGG